jgi:hypothetical protein
MTNLSEFVKILFKNKRDYPYLEHPEKEAQFFIFNRFMARRYPENANILNRRGIDKSFAADIWFDYHRSYTAIPTWFYPRPGRKTAEKKTTAIEGLDDMDMLILHTGFKQELDEHNEAQLRKSMAVVVKKKKTSKRG